MSNHARAVGQALLVTFLWSTSFVITKWIYADGGVGPLWLNALRYATAALLLSGYRALSPSASGCSLTAMPRSLWLKLVALGTINYGLTQGGQMIGLHLLPSSHVAMILNLNNTLQVLLFSAILLKERPSLVQWVGIGLGLAGAAAFYYPLASPPGGWVGAIPVLAAGVGYAATTIWTRQLMRDRTVSALDLTVVSMLAGAATMAAVAAAAEGMPVLSARSGLLLLWLASVNTALAFTLWAHTQKVLVPFETSTLNNTMLVQIALLSWLLLGEPLGGLKLPGIGLVTMGTFLVQAGPHWLRRRAERHGRGPGISSSG